MRWFFCVHISNVANFFKSFLFSLFASVVFDFFDIHCAELST